MRGRKDGKLHAVCGNNNFAFAPSAPFQWESEERSRQINSLQPRTERGDQFGGQINRQGPRARREPRRLQQHGQATGVIRVSVRDEHRIDLRNIDPLLDQALAARLARIDEKADRAKLH